MSNANETERDLLERAVPGWTFIELVPEWNGLQVFAVESRGELIGLRSAAVLEEKRDARATTGRGLPGADLSTIGHPKRGPQERSPI